MLARLDVGAVAQPNVTWVPRSVGVGDLKAAMQPDHPIRTNDGVLLLKEGETISPSLLERLRAFAAGVGIVEPIDVLVAVKS